MNEVGEEPQFLSEYVRNGYYKHVMTSTAESKHVFKDHKLH